MKTVRRVVAALGIAVVLGVVAGGFALWHAGYRVYAVRTGSMSPDRAPGSAVVVRPVSQVDPGQVITFHPAPGTTVTHRVVDVSGAGIQTKGDANATPDPWRISASQVVGGEVVHLPYGGYMLVFLQQPSGIGAIAVFLLAVGLAWSLFFPTTPEPAKTPGGSGRHRARHQRTPGQSPA